MSKQLAKIVSTKGIYLVEYHEKAKYNPYRVYLKWYDGYWHKNQIEAYADMASCLFEIGRLLTGHEFMYRPEQ